MVSVVRYYRIITKNIFIGTKRVEKWKKMNYSETRKWK